ncbi:hypothetical protein ACQCVE_11815 [Metabacillus sp. 113a]|uniref:hypothetical protein n=1 Tax=Metabacillus sp. 113a TaxID=3404706 RepID=UPI003CF036B8
MFLTWIGMLLLAVLIFMIIRVSTAPQKKLALGGAAVLAVIFVMIGQSGGGQSAAVSEKTEEGAGPASEEKFQLLEENVSKLEAERDEKAKEADQLKDELAEADASREAEIETAVSSAKEEMEKAHEEEMKEVLDTAFKNSSEKAAPVQAEDDISGEPETPSNKPSEYDPFGPDLDCGDFAAQEDAQTVYEAAGGPEKDPHDLDRDNDGIACFAN